MTERGSSVPLRAAIIGAGLMGRWHADAVRHAGHRVTCVYDADVSRGASLAQREHAQMADSLVEAIAACDVVHVCTPPATHVGIATQALQQDRSVICEKPIAESPSAVRALFDLAADKRSILVPTHQFLFQRGMQQVMARLGALGTVRHIDATACTAGATGRDDDGAEAVALEVLPHPLSLIARLMPGVLDQLTWSVPRGVRGEIRAIAGTGDCTLAIMVSCGGRPPVNQLRLVGTLGTATVDLFHGFAVIDTGRASQLQKVGQPFTSGARQVSAAAGNLALRAARREPAYPGLRELVALTYSAVRDASAPPLGAAECVAVAEACERIRVLRQRTG